MDLRGLTLSAVVKGCQLESVDFSDIVTSQFGQFSALNQLRNCLFVGATFGANLRQRFEQCDFTRADLRGAVFGKEFIDCRFDEADLGKVMGTEVVFTRCTFQRTQAVDAQLVSCRFVECDFTGAAFHSGSLGRAQFENCRGNP